jgi:hypothetical protein
MPQPSSVSYYTACDRQYLNTINATTNPQHAHNNMIPAVMPARMRDSAWNLEVSQ